MSDLAPPLTVYVVSWVNWFAGEQTSGGFDWYYAEADARGAFAQEKADVDQHYGLDDGCRGEGRRVRLVEVTLDLHPARVDAETITRWIDDRIDLIEDFHQTHAAGDRCLAVALAAA